MRSYVETSGFSNYVGRSLSHSVDVVAFSRFTTNKESKTKIEQQKLRDALIRQSMQQLFTALEYPASKVVFTVRKQLSSSLGLDPNKFVELITQLNTANVTDQVFDAFVENLATKNILDERTLPEIYNTFFSQGLFKDDVTILHIFEGICLAVQRREAVINSTENS